MTQPETPVPQPAPAEGAAPGREVRMKLFARTDVGQVREHNEDNFLVADLTRRQRGLLDANRALTLGHQGAIFAVCDGMGGAAAGEIASQLAVDIIYERLVDGLDDKTALRRDELARRLVRAVETAGLRIFQEAKNDRTRRGMGTTVTAAALVDDILFLAQVGDSRGYILRGEQLVQVTRDQSLVNQLIEAGQLTEEEAETFEHNNIILQALGTADTVQVDLTFAELRQGDILMLCSDGLSGMVRGEEIRELLKTQPEPLDACKALTERANQAGGHDNITVIVVHFDGEGLKPNTPDGEALKYRKYPLPEEPLENTEPRGRPSQRDPVAAQAAAPKQPSVGPPPTALFSQPEGGGAQAGAPGATAQQAPTSGGWQERGAYGNPEDDRIEIPGTHIPAWIVVAIVLGVIALLGATAFVLLR